MRTLFTGGYHYYFLLLIMVCTLMQQSCVSMMFGNVDVTLNKNVEQGKYKRIAVVPYDVSGYDGMGMDKVSGTAMSDRYTYEFMKNGFDVIERQRLEVLIREHELSMIGLTDPRTSHKIGKILGVQGFVFGSVSGRPNAFSVMTKLVDVETGSVVWSIVITNNIEKNAIKKLRHTLDAHFAKGGK